MNLTYPVTFGGLINYEFRVPGPSSCTLADMERKRWIGSWIFQSVNMKHALIFHDWNSSIIATKSLNR